MMPMPTQTAATKIERPRAVRRIRRAPFELFSAFPVAPSITPPQPVRHAAPPAGARGRTRRTTRLLCPLITGPGIRPPSPARVATATEHADG